MRCHRKFDFAGGLQVRALRSLRVVYITITLELNKAIRSLFCTMMIQLFRHMSASQLSTQNQK
jgi:hypothetical protein